MYRYCFIRKKAFDKDELKLLEIVSQQIESAINNARKAEELRISKKALYKANNELELRVKKRTKELFDTNKELRNEMKKRKCAEDQIKASLNEKEILLMEIQHRVKNNLQVITSLLDLQKDYVKEKRVRNDFIEIQSRIRSMALIHEQIYKSKDLTKIDFAEYVTNLVTYLFDSYGMSSRVIKLKNNIGDPSLNVDRALTCGMIVNELVSNSLKHAFPEGRSGEICIDLHREDNNCILTIGDDGIGFPKGLNFRKTKTLGLQLVISLTRQLEGSIKLNRRDGTVFTIEFPEN
ncbi:ATP-binding protein [Desulfobacterota bacterium AH_259_B03_O07]|nr:ATP-binding protein [Desulfobacterota bacterium AH_259_B03_O07]